MDENELENRFTYHDPKDGQAQRFEEIRGMGKAFAEIILTLCPPSREQSLAITAIEEAVMWGNASIARRE
ncbi:conserved hypothetical protein [Candidatus Desulfosporosinus infrequens]|uniref:Acb2/Tad1 hairpin domain-containing protein n=1 Tax=Candidatus Desulfosporosinus infrequens TaxID=2043169 RepID=A0A2U3LHB6_9FIRM|nr:conserved hypothetical protein [Candidatus Desulfosporosinus infrequens]